MSSNPPEHTGEPIPLASAPPDCTETYHGQFTAASLYIVGRGTDQEHLYLKGQGEEARRVGRRDKLTVDHVRATDVCHETVVALFGG
jgi:hypothetical protein